jgi:hypothetical protein
MVTAAVTPTTEAAAPSHRPLIHRRDIPDVASGSRIEGARARARGAKAALGVLTTLVFGVAFVGARAHAPGHSKHRATPLGAPSAFEQAVRRSALQGGQIAPPVQPPTVVTSTS